MTTFTIAGTGNGGSAFAGDLSLRGYPVRLFDLEDFSFRLDAIRRAGGIHLTGAAAEGHAKMAAITTDPEEAMAGSDVVLIAAPAFAQEVLFKRLAPHARDGQAFIFISYFGALLAKRWLKDLGLPRRILIGETQSLLYAARLRGSAAVRIYGVKKYMGIATLPPEDSDEVLARLSGAFPPLRPEANVLQTSFDNLNPIVHAAIFTFNLARVEENKGDWGFYADGPTQAVGRVMKAMEGERLEIMKALKLRAEPYEDIMRRLYRSPDDRSPILRGKSHLEMLRSSPIHTLFKDAPDHIAHRYYTEDVPYGLVPFSLFGKLAGTETRAMDAIITLASIVEEVDYFKEGITLKNLGMEGLTISEMIALVS